MTTTPGFSMLPPQPGPSWEGGWPHLEKPIEISRTVLHEGRVITLSRRQVRIGDRVYDHEVIEHPGAVVLVPWLDGELLLVRQWRHPIGDLLELPAGTVERGEAPEVCAAREIREETGFAAGHLIRLTDAYAAPGYSTEMLHFFLATDLRPSPLPTPEEEALSVVRMPFREALDEAARGRFQDTKTSLGILLAARHLEGLREGRGT